MDLGELVGDLAEAFGEAGLEGGVEFFVDGDAHLFKLGGVGGVELLEALLDAGAKALGGGLVLLPGLVEGGGEGGAEGGEVGDELGAEGGAAGRGLGALLGELGAEMGVEGVEAGVEAGDLRGQVGGEELGEARVGGWLRGRGAAQQEHEEGDECECLEGDEGDEHFGFPSPLRIARAGRMANG